MKKVITIGGSNSKNSINKQLAEYVGGRIKNVELVKIDLNDFEMPIFSIDIENEEGFTDSTRKLNLVFDEVDGFIISLAEHNGSYSAAFKNIYDWLSRLNGKVWREKPMILLSTSPGARGGYTVLNTALSGFPYLGANIIGSLSLGSFYDNYKGGEIVDKTVKATLDNIISDFEKVILL